MIRMFKKNLVIQGSNECMVYFIEPSLFKTIVQSLKKTDDVKKNILSHGSLFSISHNGYLANLLKINSFVSLTSGTENHFMQPTNFKIGNKELFESDIIEVAGKEYVIRKDSRNGGFIGETQNGEKIKLSNKVLSYNKAKLLGNIYQGKTHE